MRPLLVACDERLGRKIAQQRVLHALRRGFPVAADLPNGVLMDVDRHGDADLLLQKAALAGLAVSMGKSVSLM